MNNPLLTKSALPYGAPHFDKIENQHYIPAFKQAIAEAMRTVWQERTNNSNNLRSNAK
jgi:Zn-dependent oligopeptidase